MKMLTKIPDPRTITPRQILKWFVNHIIRMSVWMFFMHVGAASIYYIWNDIYVTMGIQPGPTASITLVFMVVVGSFYCARLVNARVIR